MSESEKITDMLLKADINEPSLSSDFDESVMSDLEGLAPLPEPTPLTPYFWPAAAAIVIFGVAALYDGMNDTLFEGLFYNFMNLL